MIPFCRFVTRMETSGSLAGPAQLPSTSVTDQSINRRFTKDTNPSHAHSSHTKSSHQYTNSPDERTRPQHPALQNLPLTVKTLPSQQQRGTRPCRALFSAHQAEAVSRLQWLIRRPGAAVRNARRHSQTNLRVVSDGSRRPDHPR